MPRTPRSREEIENESLSGDTIAEGQYLRSKTILEVLLDIRDAVMEGRAGCEHEWLFPDDVSLPHCKKCGLIKP